MFDRNDLKSAVDANILTAETARKFELWLQSRQAPTSDGAKHEEVEGEALRFISSLNDIFITMGLGIFLFGSISLLGVSLAGGLETRPALPLLVISSYSALASWFLAEYFCKRRRMLLPGMLLAIVFTLSGMLIGAGLVALARGVNVPEINFGFINTAKELGYLGLLMGLAANGLFFWRFRLPFCFAIFGAMGLIAIYLVIFDNSPAAVVNLRFVGLLLGGFASLAGAIWFDRKDPARLSRTSDHAFWLHLVAAPQIIYGIQDLIQWTGIGLNTAMGALVVIAALAGLTILALILNRRALVVASLISLSAAVGTILSSTNVGLEITIPLAATLVGSMVILIGGGWNTARRGVRSALGMPAPVI